MLADVHFAKLFGYFDMHLNVIIKVKNVKNVSFSLGRICSDNEKQC